MAAILGSRKSSSALMLLAQLVFVAGLLVGWQVLASRGTINAFVVGTPLKILDNIWSWLQDGSLVGHTVTTMAVTLAGYTAALLIGVTVGTIAGTFPSIGRIISPFVTFWQGFPRLVFYPFFAVALGYTVASRMIHVAFVIIFVIIVSTAAGVADVDPDIRHNARILGANRWQVIRDTRLPAAVLWVGTSARITFGFAVQAAIVAEFTGADSGLGFLMVKGQNSFDVNVVWAATFAAIVFAVLVDRALLFVQAYFSRWQADQP
ncbi:ABC transporter permease [Pseudarthrobacter sp. fls2-241-R2A-168]|uniref:ABC transporter permease n=1 Tax=Pseudarthrobacter sp. fls2-241-R2A-168 TaxID=3040304 RepID=UPI0025572ADD|nr:ABC transporter permease [Pseudarthrobacter sp. fls2-241-R2A-168]